MPTIYSNTVEDWGMQCLGHMKNVPECHGRLSWPGNEREGGIAASLTCIRCGTWLSLRAEALRASDHSTRIVADFLRTDWGKHQLLLTLLERGKTGLRPGEHPFDPDVEPLEPENRKTGWSRVLDDDPFEDP